MKKVFISILLSGTLLFTVPSFAASSPNLYHPEIRANSASVLDTNHLSKVGTNYAYRYHRHWHRWAPQRTLIEGKSALNFYTAQ